MSQTKKNHSDVFGTSVEVSMAIESYLDGLQNCQTRKEFGPKFGLKLYFTIVFEEHSEKKHFKVQGCSFHVPIVY